MSGIREFIYEQPKALRKVFAEVPSQLEPIISKLADKPLKRIYLVGSGTSKNALICLEQTIQKHFRVGLTIANPVGFGRHLSNSDYSDSLGIFLSQSGTSTTTVNAVKNAQSRGMQTLVITAEKESPIAKLPGQKLIMPIGKEQIGPKTKGYTTSIATLLITILELATAKGLSQSQITSYSAEINQYLDELEKAIPSYEVLAEKLANEYYQCDHIMVLAAGRHIGTALEGSLKITEICGIGSSAYDIEEGLHGRFHGLNEKSLALFIAQSPEELEQCLQAIAVLQELGICCHLLTSCNTEVNEEWQTVIDLPDTAIPEIDLIPFIIPLQFFARSLAIKRAMIPENMKYPDLSRRLNIKLAK